MIDKDTVLARHPFKLRGYQCQPMGDLREHTRRLMQFVADVTGWQLQARQIDSTYRWTVDRVGQRHSQQIGAVRRQGLDHFVGEKNVFSFVFPSNTTINYTCGIGDHA